MFMIGTSIFGAGSLLAAFSDSVPALFVGEAVIEGIGASMMMPATVALLTNSFRGHERALAFGAWATVGGATIAFGPLIGGYLTTYHSWRWAFGINVIAAPLAVLGAFLLVTKDQSLARRERLDVPGAALAAVGMFLVIFAIIEGSTYGFVTPIRDFAVLGWHWPSGAPISIVPIAFVSGAATLVCFYLVERSKERRDAEPLFEFGLLRRYRRFRWGLLTALLSTMGQFGLFFVLAVVLQSGQHLAPVDAGLWLVPAGLAVVLGAQTGARLTRRIGVVRVVRIGMFIEAAGLFLLAIVITEDVAFLSLLPGLLLFGLGTGFAVSQVTNVTMSDVPPDKAGVAGGANTTIRQSGFALGIAILGSLLTSVTVRNAIDGMRRADLDRSVTRLAIERLHDLGVNFSPPRGAGPTASATVETVFARAIADGARPALLFAAVVVLLGAIVSRLIPEVAPGPVEIDVAQLEAGLPL
jgi:MFS family permease